MRWHHNTPLTGVLLLGVFVVAFFAIPVQKTFAHQQDQVLAADVTCFDLDGAYVLSQESPPTYLGFFGNQFASDSIMNTFGTYGSQFSSLSVRNSFGTYGSSFGTYSANNRFSTTPPGIFKNGSLIAYLTTNTLIVGGVSLAVIDDSCTFSAASPAIITLPPAAPASVSASDGLYTDAIEVTWTPVSDATHYVVYRAESVDDTPEPITATVGSLLPVFDGVPGKVYWFWVAASNSSGLSELSAPDSGYIAAPSSSFSLSVQKSGDGSGSVMSSPGGINCGPTCNAEYAEGTVVTLTITSEVGSSFSSWSGACTGITDCVVTINADTAVTAEFTKDDEPPSGQTVRVYMPMAIR